MNWEVILWTCITVGVLLAATGIIIMITVVHRRKYPGIHIRLFYFFHSDKLCHTQISNLTHNYSCPSAIFPQAMNRIGNKKYCTFQYVKSHITVNPVCHNSRFPFVSGFSAFTEPIL